MQFLFCRLQVFPLRAGGTISAKRTFDVLDLDFSIKLRTLHFEVIFLWLYHVGFILTVVKHVGLSHVFSK